MDDLTSRQIGVLFTFPIFIIIAIILGILILRRDPHYKANQFFALAFFSVSAALLFNLIYLFSQDTFLISTLNKASIGAINVGVIIMLFGILTLYKGEHWIKETKTLYLFIILLIILLTVLNFLPVYVNIPEFTPIWSLQFGIFQLVFGQSLFVGLLYFSILLYRELSTEIKHRFKRFVLGTIFINLTATSIAIQNMRLFENYEPIAAVLNLGAFIAIILIYFGIIRR
ncbi:MAG: hypothetical protein LUQ65_06275 [Candidatus Helarchaeota archaeon]|nr:hypothetical protein [Candidatus Helarchaeota archaeon]